MGLRKASVRRSDVVVMAPALTETQNSQNFKFASTVSLSLKDAVRLKNPGPPCAEGMNGHSSPSPTSKTTYNINGLAKNLKNEFLPINQSGNDISEVDHQMMNDGMGHSRKTDDELPEPDDFKGLVITNDDLATPENDLGQEEVEELLSALKPAGFEFGKDFLDVINMSEDLLGVSAPSKETLLNERIENSKKSLHEFHRRRSNLLRKLRRLEGTFLGKHVAEEVTGVVEYSTGLLEAANRGRAEPGKKTSFAAMSLFMRQVDHAANQQANAAAKAASKNFKYFGSGSSSSALPTGNNGLRNSVPGTILPSFPPEVSQELDIVSHELSAQQRKVLQDLDSEATESSSGGESADEMVTYNNTQQHPLSM